VAGFLFLSWLFARALGTALHPLTLSCLLWRLCKVPWANVASAVGWSSHWLKEAASWLCLWLNSLCGVCAALRLCSCDVALHDRLLKLDDWLVCCLWLCSTLVDRRTSCHRVPHQFLSTAALAKWHSLFARLAVTDLGLSLLDGALSFLDDLECLLVGCRWLCFLLAWRVWVVALIFVLGRCSVYGSFFSYLTHQIFVHV